MVPETYAVLCLGAEGQILHKAEVALGEPMPLVPGTVQIEVVNLDPADLE